MNIVAWISLFVFVGVFALGATEDVQTPALRGTTASLVAARGPTPPQRRAAAPLARPASPQPRPAPIARRRESSLRYEVVEVPGAPNPHQVKYWTIKIHEGP